MNMLFCGMVVAVLMVASWNKYTPEQAVDSPTCTHSVEREQAEEGEVNDRRRVEDVIQAIGHKLTSVVE